MSDYSPRGRDAFASTLGAFAATLGSAIGLGNIWKFPYLTGSNGGAAFVLVYLLSIAFVGIPILVVEHTIGRKMRMNAVHAYGAVIPGQKFWAGIGLAGVAAAFLIMAFYTDVAGWVFAYVFKSFAALFTGATLDAKTFGALAGGTWEPLCWQVAVLVLTTGIIAAGVSKGIEKVTKTLMPLLFILLVVCDLRALTLPGAGAGVAYLFRPDLSLTRIANHLKISEAYLSRVFKEHEGESPSDYIERKRLEESVRLLRGSDLGIAGIAVRIGYLSDTAFRRAFKRKFGMSPIDYRNCAPEA